MKLLVTSIQEFCVHDGPGLRTTVFLKGCPLHCPWCCNPESISPVPQPYFLKQKCVAANGLCPYGNCPFATGEADTRKNLSSLRKDQIEQCRSGALGIYGKWMTQDDLYSELMKGRVFWGETGGITFSGGEPLMQWDALRPLVEHIKRNGVNVWLETSLNATGDVVLAAATCVDGLLVDIKSMSSSTAYNVIGMDLNTYHKNLAVIEKCGTPVLFRHPEIAGYTDDEITDSFLSSLSFDGKRAVIERLPEHHLAHAKQVSLGILPV